MASRFRQRPHPDARTEHLPLPPPIARRRYQFPGALEVTAGGVALVRAEVEARPLEVGIGLVETHVAALGDLLGLGQVGRGGGDVAAEAVEGGAGQEAAGNVVLATGLPQAVHGPFQVVRGRDEVRGGGRQGQAEMGAAKEELVEGES